MHSTADKGLRASSCSQLAFELVSLIILKVLIRKAVEAKEMRWGAKYPPAIMYWCGPNETQETYIHILMSP